MREQKLWLIPESAPGRVILTIEEVKKGVAQYGSVAQYAASLGVPDMAFYQALRRAGYKIVRTSVQVVPMGDGNHD